MLGGDDDPWRLGNPNRTPEEAMAEYWGEDRVLSDTTLGALETGGQVYESRYGAGTKWQEHNGGRFMRYETIPFHQKLSREGADYDIEETLGSAGRELDAHVRRWDMDRLRKPRGQEYRTYGPRSGHIM